LDQGWMARCADHIAVIACNECVMTMVGVYIAHMQAKPMRL